MASKENAERKELHRKIWAIADDVRGAVDGWDFKRFTMLKSRTRQNSVFWPML